jgi:hypothetical protein
VDRDMGKIVNFKPRKTSNAPRKKTKKGQSAEIFIFNGVRYEYHIGANTKKAKR